MKTITILFLIFAVILIGIYTYDYYNQPRLSTISDSNPCLNANEMPNYGLFKQDNYQLYLPKDWPFMNLNTGNSKNSFTFGINNNDSYEFVSIWSGDYNKTTDTLVLDTLKPLDEYVIDSQETVKTNSNEELKKVTILFKGETNTIKQDIYVYTKNNIGYILVFRAKSFDYNNYLPTMNKIICSFKTNN